MLLKFDKFGGEAPSITPHKLLEHMAQKAINCDTRHGDLRPVRGMTTLDAIGDPTARTIFRNNYEWFYWNRFVDIARSPLPNNNGRAYVVNETINGPREFDYTTQGADPVPAGHLLAKPAPTNAPTVTLGAGGGCDVSVQTSITVVYTYVTDWAEETGPSPASAVYDVCNGQEVTIGAFAAPPLDRNITKIRIYVAFAGFFQFLSELDTATASYLWTFATDDLGEALETEDWDPLPDDAKGMIVLPNGNAAAYVGNEILLAEPWQLHAWPIKYRKSVDHDITALVTVGNVVAVLTQGTPYLMFGSHPSVMELRRLESPHACTGTLSAVDLGDVAIYAGPEGLVEISPSGVTRSISEPWYTPDDWRKLINPETVRGYRWGDAYLGFYARANNVTYATCVSKCTDPLVSYDLVKGGFIYDRNTDGLRYLEAYAEGGRWTPDIQFSEIVGGYVALLVNGDIVRWADEDADYLTAVWRSRPFEAPRAINMGAAQVYAAGYPVTLHVVGDGLVQCTVQVANDGPFRLPSGYRCREWAIELETKHPIRKALLAETMKELSQI